MAAFVIREKNSRPYSPLITPQRLPAMFRYPHGLNSKLQMIFVHFPFPNSCCKLERTGSSDKFKVCCFKISSLAEKFANFEELAWKSPWRFGFCFSFPWGSGFNLSSRSCFTVLGGSTIHFSNLPFPVRLNPVPVAIASGAFGFTKNLPKIYQKYLIYQKFITNLLKNFNSLKIY